MNPGDLALILDKLAYLEKKIEELDNEVGLISEVVFESSPDEMDN